MTSRTLSGFVLGACLVAAGVSLNALGVRAAVQSQQAAQGGEDEFLKGAYTKETPGLTLPKIRTSRMPKYTPQAMKAKIQGTVEVQAVVSADGKVDRVRVTQSLDKTNGLDEEALKAAKDWTFVPGVLDNKTVPVAITLRLDFRLH